MPLEPEATVFVVLLTRVRDVCTVLSSSSEEPRMANADMVIPAAVVGSCRFVRLGFSRNDLTPCWSSRAPAHANLRGVSGL